jgi:2-methylisocitrate lyase-like PEP mutase family enzyme
VVDRERLGQLAEQLRALHRGPEPLVLPNVWDAASARIVIEAGFPVVATTSSGVTASLGWPDGEQAPPDEVFAALGRIARAIAAPDVPGGSEPAPSVPLTVDIEAGYSLAPARLVERLLEVGAVGCNLEDTDHAAGRVLRDAERQAGFLAAVRRAAEATRVNVVINARVDVFLGAPAGSPPPIEEAIRRGRLYLEAGADCIFPIGATDQGAIAALVDGIPGPTNQIANFRGGPGMGRLRELGVRRISFAGGLHRAAFDELRRRVAAIANGEEV